MKKALPLALLLVGIHSGSALADGARYLIIAPDGYEDELLPLAQWKTRKGMPARIVTTSETGYSVQQIQAYVIDAVETWDPAPEYVLIAADLNTISMGTESGYVTDTTYGNLDDDLFVEIIPGRFPAASGVQVETMVAKTLQYERNPDVSDEFFYHSAALLIYEDSDDDDICSYWGDATWECTLMERAGFTDVSIMSYQTTSGIYNLFEAQLNAGIGWAVHHGVVGGNCDWPGYGVDPEYLTNGPMLPIIVGFTCQTLGYTGYTCYGERWLQSGTPDNLIGGVAYVGQAASCSYCAHWRSALRYYEEFRTESQYLAATAYGDPELNVWTDVPREFSASHPPILPRGPIEFSVLVTQDGEPREDALVCAMSDEGTYDYDYTDSDGLVTFGVDTTEDLSLYLTVTGRNLIPYEGSIDVYEVGAPVDTGEPIPDDSSEPDTGEREQPPPGIAHGGACGCGGGLPAAGPFAFLLLPLWLRRRSRDAGRPA